MLSEMQLRQIRSRFPIFQRKVYLNSCSQGALSDAVEQGVQSYLDSWHQEGSPWERWIEKYEAVRAQFARFIGAEAAEVAIVPSASAGINTIASAFDFSQRDKVVLGEFEFPTMGHVWLAQQPRGARIEFVSSEGGRIRTASYAQTIDDRTAVVPITHVCFMNGFRSNVAEITRLAHAQGALAFLDDYQDCGTRPVDVKSVDVDFYVSGTLKYLLAAPGVAFLYVRKSLISSLTPTISGWFAQDNPFSFDVRHLVLAPDARRFEAGTPPIPNLYAASAGIGLLEEIGLENVAGQVHRLAQALIEGAQALGIRIKTPLDTAGPLVVLQTTAVSEVVARLAAEDIVVSGRHDGVRISFHVHNTMDDVQRVLESLKKNRDLMVRETQNA
ncbi:MAG TPA: aminotransferase class V-fold PLP-dependent enzyme [Candidatus Acidoferrales bacterium]|nr:aminotransferase class V-fold PLP-dependent enzyme [Candidatus Acidoferrales bacterium]